LCCSESHDFIIIVIPKVNIEIVKIASCCSHDKCSYS
jgi:hypothetical protein